MTHALAFILAQAASAAPSLLSKLFDLVTPGSVGAVLAVVLSAIGGFQFFTEKRKKAVALATYYGFHVVEDVVDNLDDGAAKDGFAKVDTALKAVDEWMVANGWRPLKPGEVSAAKIQLSAIAGENVVKQGIAIAAATASKT